MMEDHSKLAAPCGMYCGVCAIYIAHRDNNLKFKERLTGLYGVAIAWQWLLQAVTAAKALGETPAAADADFYQGKIQTCRYFFAYELPKIRGLAARLKESGDGITVTMKPEWFE